MQSREDSPSYHLFLFWFNCHRYSPPFSPFFPIICYWMYCENFLTLSLVILTLKMDSHSLLFSKDSFGFSPLPSLLFFILRTSLIVLLTAIINGLAQFITRVGWALRVPPTCLFLSAPFEVLLCKNCHPIQYHSSVRLIDFPFPVVSLMQGN